MFTKPEALQLSDFHLIIIKIEKITKMNGANNKTIFVY